LNASIEILVIDDILIVPNTDGRVGHSIGDERHAIESRRRLDLVDGRLRISGRCPPRIDGRLRSHRCSGRRKAETGRARNSEPAVGHVVIHVALRGWPLVALAPGVLMRRDVLTFRVVGRAGVLSCA
jgi:hypothetical protein